MTISHGREGSNVTIRPPLVSLVLINWNYDAYVGAAVESIKNQEYPCFEAIVVDNGSTDESRDVIARHVRDDSRFRVIQLRENLGQLGAFLDSFEAINGEFVAIVDADDVLFPNFVSSHIQVHLALPYSVALTSSNVVEMTAGGRVLAGRHSSFNPEQPNARGLRPPALSLRLSTISNRAYRQLSKAASMHVDGARWIWGPGTSNMYRHSALALVHYKPKDRTCFRSADSYLCRFCHVLGGSGLIDKHLSAYRIHGGNYFSERESIYKLPAGRIEARQRLQQLALETLDVLFARAHLFEQLLPAERFWKAVDLLAHNARDKEGKILVSPEGPTPFSDNYETLKRVFGEDELLVRLKQRLRTKDLQSVLNEAYDGGLPPHLQTT